MTRPQVNSYVVATNDCVFGTFKTGDILMVVSNPFQFLLPEDDLSVAVVNRTTPKRNEAGENMVTLAMEHEYSTTLPADLPKVGDLIIAITDDSHGDFKLGDVLKVQSTHYGADMGASNLTSPEMGERAALIFGEYKYKDFTDEELAKLDELKGSV